MPPWRTVVPATVALVAWQGFLWLYFHAIVPNTLVAKTHDKYTGDFLTALPRTAVSLANLPLGPPLALLLALGTVAFVRAAPARLVLFLAAQVAGYALLRTADHVWYYYAVGLVEACGVACGLAWIVARLWPRPEAWRTAAMVLLALGLLPSRYTLAAPVTQHGDFQRTLAYREAAAGLRAALRPGDAVLGDEIGTLGLELPGVRILDTDFLIHRRPAGVPRERRRDRLAVRERPAYFLTPSDAGGGAITFTWNGESVTYDRARQVRVGNYEVHVYAAR
jgi:hypothetical protein